MKITLVEPRTRNAGLYGFNIWGDHGELVLCQTLSMQVFHRLKERLDDTQGKVGFDSSEQTFQHSYEWFPLDHIQTNYEHAMLHNKAQNPAD